MSQTRRLAAILAADVAGYSRLMGVDEEGTLEQDPLKPRQKRKALPSRQGDRDMAVFWYRHARDLGATGVASRLKKLEAKEGRN